VEQAFKVLEGRWKLLILFHLFGGKILRFSELERAIPAISQKMLIQQLRQMENDGMVRRIVHIRCRPRSNTR
jgi:DNA-binding HxlR family transcriptional regulator